MISNQKHFSQKGQTLMEALVALGTAVVVMTAIAISVTTALNNALYAKTQNQAAQYAQEGMEYMRAFRNSNYQTFSSYANGNIYCLKKPITIPLEQRQLPNPCPLIDKVFDREAVLRPSNTDLLNKCGTVPNQTIQVTVSVKWSDSKCTDSNNSFCHQVELNTCLSDSGIVSGP